MNFKFNIQTTEEIIRFNPTKLEIWVGSTDTVNEELVTNVETETTEILSNGTRVEHKKHQFPATALQAIINGFDLKTGLPKISLEALNVMLAEFNLKVIE